MSAMLCLQSIRGRGPVVAALLVLLLTACAARLPEPALPQMDVARRPAISVDLQSGEHYVEIDVLTYNVAGLPWPVAKGRAKAMKRIGDQLARLRAQDKEPDVVLVQEGFIAASGEIIERSGYPNFVRGPRRRDDALEILPPLERLKADGVAQRGRFVGSGLYALSNFPILEKRAKPFPDGACAGYDCWANKGMLLIEIHVPGVPEPIQLLTTHLNSRRASGAPHPKTLAAHNRQMDELAAFLAAHADQRRALILGGDFNMRNAPDRFAHATSHQTYSYVRQHCHEWRDACRVDIAHRTETPWMESQILQGFRSGSRVTVQPVQAKLIFNGPEKPLSDHAGYLVRYRLSWQPLLQQVRTSAGAGG